MTTLLSAKRSAPAAALLLFSAVILINATTARADQITYNIFNPGDQTDENNGGLDSIAGSTITITGNGLDGYVANDTIPNDDITSLAYSVTIQNTHDGNVVSATFTGSGPLSDFEASGTPSFTGSQIFLQNAYLSLDQGGGVLYWNSIQGSF